MASGNVCATGSQLGTSTGSAMVKLSAAARAGAVGAASARAAAKPSAAIRAIIIDPPSLRQIGREFLLHRERVGGEARGDARRHAAGIDVVDAAPQPVDD